MATVTGFTAERMLQIENTTVVDGDVVGNNLILLQRDGTQIDAGNVRGPQGIQGIPGPVPSVNDQTGAVYAPRIFATKALLDTWVTCPIGTLAVTIDNDTVWEKGVSGWYVSNTDRIFADLADLTAKWTNPPQGAIAQIRDGDSSLYKSAASNWTPNNGIRTFPSVARRDSDWPNAPDGAVCFAPAPVQWLRQGGVWKAFGVLWTGYVQINGMSAAGPVFDVKMANIPAMPVDTGVTVQVNGWAGFSANSISASMGAYTNNMSSPSAGSGWSIQGIPPVNLAPGAWGAIGSLTLVYSNPAGIIPDTFIRLQYTGLGANCYFQFTTLTTVIAK